MATIDVGKLSFTHKGDYSSSTAYVLNDVVYYNGSAYIAKQSTTNNVPTNTTYWSTFASGLGGIYDSTLSIGSANQVLAVNSGATALEFQTASSGKIKQVVYGNFNGYASTTSTSFQDTGVAAQITPNHANNLILIWATLGEPDWTDGRLACHVHKNGSALTYGRLVSEMGRGLSNTGSETHRGTIGFNVVNVAGGTSQITYDLKYKSGNGGTVRFGNGGSSNIILMEYEV